MPRTSKVDPRIDAYIEDAAPFAQPILRKLRTLVHRADPEAVETTKWNSPSFMHGDKILCSMAAFKAHAIFGFWGTAMNAVLRQDPRFSSHAMGDFGRMTNIRDLPPDRDLVRYIRIAAGLIDGGAPRRDSRRKRPEARIPTELATALRGNAQAAKTFREFSPTLRREYIEWITAAKRPETRARRIVETVKALTLGRSRNWKYES